MAAYTQFGYGTYPSANQVSVIDNNSFTISFLSIVLIFIYEQAKYVLIKMDPSVDIK